MIDSLSASTEGISETLNLMRGFPKNLIKSSFFWSRLTEAARLAVSKSGFNPDYYLHTVSTSDMHESDHRRSMLVQMDDGRVLTLGEAEPLFISMVKESSHYAKNWLVLPEEAKELLGRERWNSAL